MRSLIQEMIHYRNGLDDSEECSPEKIAEYEGRCRAILECRKHRTTLSMHEHACYDAP